MNNTASCVIFVLYILKEATICDFFSQLVFVAPAIVSSLSMNIYQSMSLLLPQNNFKNPFIFFSFCFSVFCIVNVVLFFLFFFFYIHTFRMQSQSACFNLFIMVFVKIHVGKKYFQKQKTKINKINYNNV